MEFETKSAGDYSIVAINEERLDAHAAVAFKEHMAGEIDSGKKMLILDLTKTVFIDSSGLGAIVSTLKRIGSDGKLVIAGLNPKTRSVFELTRMDRVFDIHESLDAAMTSLGIAQTA